MQQKLNVWHVLELPDAEKVESDLPVGYCDRRTVVPYLCELAPNDLIPLQVERADGSFIYPTHSAYVRRVRNVIVDTWIIVDPMMVDRDIAPENTFVDNLKRRQARHVVLSILKNYLYRFKLLLAYDRGMPVSVQILIAILPVLSVFVLVKICGKRFPCQNTSTVALVRQNIPDCAR